MLRSEAQIKSVPFNVGDASTKFARYDKISREEVFNFIQSDSFLVPFAAYKNVLALHPGLKGRDIYSSSNGNIMLAIVGAFVYVISPAITLELVGTLATDNGDVFISENNNYQIAITDGVNLYTYNYGPLTPGFTFQTAAELGFFPGYITFQNSRFVVAGLGTNSWWLSGLNNVTFVNDAQHVGTLQTKPDKVVGAIRFPGRGNLLFLFGKTVTEPWNDVGNAIFPYVRLDSFNVDYGCLSANTIAENDNIVVWLAANEQSGPAIMYSTGADIKKISTDGIDYKLSQLTAPQDSYGFLFRQDGHQLYQITFTTDNFSYVYDFNTGKFFTISDENLNYHIAKRVVFFNNNYYFVSFNDGNLYEFGTQFTNFEYSPTQIMEVPRIVIMPPSRLPNSRWFIGRSITFLIEQGQPNNIVTTTFFNNPVVGDALTTENGILLTTEDGIVICTQIFNTSVVQQASEAVDLSVSRDGGVTFGSSWRQNMNPTGIRKSRFQFLRLGQVNDLTIMLRFTGFSRFVVGSGLLEIYQ
jgi:hypothetical protein